MAKDRNRLDPDFIAKPAEGPAESTSPLAVISPQGGALTATPPSVPDVFDERRIKHDLAQLAGTPGFNKYLLLLKQRFNRKVERAALNNWASFYTAARSTVQAHTEFVRAQHDHAQLEREFVIKEKEKDLTLATLDADTEEQQLRKARARIARHNIEQGLKPSNTPRGVEGADDPAFIDRWYKQARQAIVADQTLTDQDQDHMLADLKVEYEQRRRRVYIDADLD